MLSNLTHLVNPESSCAPNLPSHLVEEKQNVNNCVKTLLNEMTKIPLSYQLLVNNEEEANDLYPNLLNIKRTTNNLEYFRFCPYFPEFICTHGSIKTPAQITTPPLRPLSSDNSLKNRLICVVDPVEIAFSYPKYSNIQDNNESINENHLVSSTIFIY